MSTTAAKRAHSPHQPTGQWIRTDKRMAIYLRDQFQCLLCESDLSEADRADITLDHLTPKCRGGSNHESNIYTCCRSCNSKRGAKAVKGPRRNRIKKYLSMDLKPFIAVVRELM